MAPDSPDISEFVPLHIVDHIPVLSAPKLSEKKLGSESALLIGCGSLNKYRHSFVHHFPPNEERAKKKANGAKLLYVRTFKNM